MKLASFGLDAYDARSNGAEKCPRRRLSVQTLRCMSTGLKQFSFARQIQPHSLFSYFSSEKTRFNSQQCDLIRTAGLFKNQPKVFNVGV